MVLITGHAAFRSFAACGCSFVFLRPGTATCSIVIRGITSGAAAAGAVRSHARLATFAVTTTGRVLRAHLGAVVMRATRLAFLPFSHLLAAGTVSFVLTLRGCVS